MSFGFALAFPRSFLWAGGFNPSSLFAAGEQGVWYDPSDINVNWRYNLLTWTEDFSNAAWTKATATVTANSTIAPDGTLTADTLTATAGFGYVLQSATATAGVSYTPSIYIKRRTGTGAIAMWNAAGTIVDITSSVTNNWTRISIPAVAATGSPVYLFLRLAVSGDAVDIWGASLTTSANASKPYQPITDGIQDYFTYQAQPILFQDAAGTQPVTAIEQPVGLMLDKSKNLTLGSELVTNGTFDTNINGWTAQFTSTAAWDNGALKSVSSGTNAGEVSQPITCVVGKWYKVTGFIVPVTASARISASTLPYGAGAGATSYTSVSGTLSFYFLATATTMYVVCGLGSGNVGVYATFDNISVKEIAGNHAYQTTGTARPTLSARYNLLAGSESLASATYWAAWGAGTCTAGITDPNGGTKAFQIDMPSVNTGWHTVNTNVPLNVQCTSGVYIRADVAGSIRFLDGNGNSTFDTTVSVTTSWQWVSTTGVKTVGQMQFGIYRNDISQLAKVYIVFPDCRVSNEAAGIPAYQRVNTTTDYDTVGFPLYLYAVTDDSMLTNSINFAAGPTNPPLGSELVTNGDFSSGTTGWTVTGDGSIAAVSGELEITRGTATTGAYQGITVTPGRTYRVTALYRKSAAAYSAILRAGTSIEGAQYGTQESFSTATSAAFIYFTATTSTLYVTGLVGGTTASSTVYFDNVSVKELLDASLAPNKMTVVAGVRKLSDATQGTLVELSADIAANNGAFAIRAPQTNATADYAALSKGTVLSTATATSYAAPITNVLTMQGDIAADSLLLRLNGSQAASSLSDQGTGNFGNYPLYLFRRNNATLPFNGRLYGLIVRGAATAAAQLGQAETYMAKKVLFTSPTITGVPTITESV